MGYYIELDQIGLDDYCEQLRWADLLPSRVILKEDIDRRFMIFKSSGLQTVEDLIQALRTKKRLNDFVTASGLPEDYLKILLREIKSLCPKPIKLADFPETPPDVITKLSVVGLTDTKSLYDRVLTADDRTALAEESSLPEKEILRMSRLTDLCRIRWVNHTFAYVLLEAGYGSAADVAQSDPETLHGDVVRLNQLRDIYKAHIGLHDMTLCVNSAKELIHEIVF